MESIISTLLLTFSLLIPIRATKQWLIDKEYNNQIRIDATNVAYFNSQRLGKLGVILLLFILNELGTFKVKIGTDFILKTHESIKFF